jgi:hypothetical protein
MKKTKLLFTLTSILLLFAVTVVAQDEGDEEEGKWRTFEVNFHGGLTVPGSALSDWKDTLGAKSGVNACLSGGYFFTSSLSAGLYFTYTQMGMDSNWDRIFRMYDFGGYAKYAFVGESSFEPYGKVTIGVNSPKFPTWVPPSSRNKLREQSYSPGLSTAVYAGLLYYTSYSGGIFAEVGFHNDFLKDSHSNYADEKIGENINYFEIRVGISVFYGVEE